MAKISDNLETQLRSSPHEVFKLIVRTSGDASSLLDWMSAEGLHVTQQFRLTPGVAVSSTGANAVKLLEQDWVVSVELDQPVSTM